ncbi:MAG: 30S ribosomal protein S11 [Vigna little leaf phytoplasma]|nr:30S ribosomal protein S11 [Vigna little leaf phytoplasma]MDV3198120.1 30S ribosomal protein S11 [Vigna little leaf phytoplasma]
MVFKKKTNHKKNKKNIVTGIVHIHTTFNNTIVTITDLQGNVVACSNAGSLGFKGCRKSTYFAAQQVAKRASSLAKEQGMKQVEVFIKGPGSAGREVLVFSEIGSFLEVTAIKDVTPVPHNGCRPPKRPRG